MRSTFQFLSVVLLLVGTGTCMLWLTVALIGKASHTEAWDAVMLVGLPIAAIGAVICVLRGTLKDALARLAAVAR